MIELENATVYHGSNLDVLPTLPDNSIDAIVTDPPYELGFMGKSWDSSGIAYSVELWQQCLRVLKPGGHLLAFSGSRTYHRMVVAIEDAGFEIRDMISWISNKTFPKSLDISKAVDKAAGAEREVIGKQRLSGNAAQSTKEKGGTFASNTNSVGVKPIEVNLTIATTDEAKQWQGWGTALKPTVEPIVMARKPLDGTVANNVLTWGVGGLNIDASRIEAADQEALEKNWDRTQSKAAETSVALGAGLKDIDLSGYKSQGRWPANVILDEHAAELVDEQSGFSKSTGVINRWTNGAKPFGNGAGSPYESIQGVADSGGASRFFYVARAGKADRNEGLEHLPDQKSQHNSGGLGREISVEKRLADEEGINAPVIKNIHPTVKPTMLMEYLIKLITPPNGVVLDPFTGSGSTGKAALLNGFKFVGIELTEEYLPIIKGRLDWAIQQASQKNQEEESKLF